MKMTPAEKMAYGNLYNKVRDAGHAENILLSECLIATISLAIAHHKLGECVGVNLSAIAAYSAEGRGSAQVDGQWRGLTVDEVGRICDRLIGHEDVGNA